MPLGSYTADADAASLPIDTVSGGFAAREIRAVKAKLNTLSIAGYETLNPLVTGGAANQYTVSQLPNNLTTGKLYPVRANRANTGAATLLPGTGTEVNITLLGGLTLQAGNIAAEHIMLLYYDGTNLILSNPHWGIGTTALYGVLQLVNDLVSADTARALTAAQGKILKDAQDAIDTDLTAAELAITALQSGKAELAGSSGQVFNVDDPTTDTHAVPRGYAATESNKGTIELADDTEVDAGTDATRALTVAQVIRILTGVTPNKITKEAIADTGITAGSNLIINESITVNPNAPSFRFVHTVRVSGTYNVRIDITASNNSDGNGYARFAIDGAVTGTITDAEFQTANGANQQFALTKDQTFSVYIYEGSASTRNSMTTRLRMGVSDESAVAYGLPLAEQDTFGA